MLEVGRIGRPHGLAGEVVVSLCTDRTNRLDPGSVLFCDDLPLVVEASRPHQGNHLVRFEGVTDRNGAESLRGRPLLAEPLDEPGVMWVHELVGAEVVATDGRILGKVQVIEANPASDLLVLDTGGLVPLNFVVEYRPGEQVTVDIPPDLLD